jgi:hypothetical protein
VYVVPPVLLLGLSISATPIDNIFAFRAPPSKITKVFSPCYGYRFQQPT